jgi:hypothetical protein
MSNHDPSWLYQRRNDLIIKLWLVFRELSDLEITDNGALSDEDIALWSLCTQHPAIQSRLNASRLDVSPLPPRGE